MYLIKIFIFIILCDIPEESELIGIDENMAFRTLRDYYEASEGEGRRGGGGVYAFREVGSWPINYK